MGAQLAQVQPVQGGFVIRQARFGQQALQDGALGFGRGQGLVVGGALQVDFQAGVRVKRGGVARRQARQGGLADTGSAAQPADQSPGSGAVTREQGAQQPVQLGGPPGEIGGWFGDGVQPGRDGRRRGQDDLRPNDRAAAIRVANIYLALDKGQQVRRQAGWNFGFLFLGSSRSSLPEGDGSIVEENAPDGKRRHGDAASSGRARVVDRVGAQRRCAPCAST